MTSDDPTAEVSPPNPFVIPETSIGNPVPTASLAVPWGIKEAAKGVGAALILFAALIFLIVTPVALIFGEDSDASLLVQSGLTAIWDIGLLFIVYRVARDAGGGWWDLGLRLPESSRKDISAAISPLTTALPRMLGTIIVGYLVCIGAVFLYQALIRLAGLDFLLPEEQIPEEILQRDWLLPVIGLAVVVTAPLGEELLFRGMVFPALRRRLPFLVSAAISGVLFSLAHLQIGLFIPFALVGMILAFYYERTKSIFIPAGIHFVFNLISFIVLAVNAANN